MADNEKFNGKLIFVIVAAALGSGFQHGYHTGVINVPQQVIKDWVNGSYANRTGDYLDTDYMSVMWGVTTSIMNLGGTIGGMVTGVISQKFGPKLGLFLNNFFVILATVLMGLSKPLNSFESMIAGRLVIGVNCGLNAGLCPMYLSEISPVSLRGAIASVYQLVITITILLSLVIGSKYIFGTEDLWIYLFIIPVVFAVVQVVMLPFCPESPRYLVSVKGNNEKAEKSLKYLRNSDDVSSDMTNIKAEDETIKALPKVTIGDMFKTRHLRIPLIIAVMMMLGQQLSGINAVMFYSTSIFKDAGLSEDNSQFATMGIGFINVLMTVVALWLVEAAGRKTLLLAAFGGMAIITLLLTVALNFSDQNEAISWMAIVLVAIYIIFFAAGAGAIPWFLVSEIFKQDARPIAVSIAVPTNWIANLLVTLTFPYLQISMKAYVFLIFVVLDLLFFVFILFKVPETKNRSIDEITSQWK